jgi:hypothetical protein
MYVRIIFVVTKGRPSRGQEVFVSICFILLELFSSLGHDYITLFGALIVSVFWDV